VATPEQAAAAVREQKAAGYDAVKVYSNQEDVKWRKPSNSMLGVPVWSHDGIICTGETYKDKVKLTFAKGASLKDTGKLFNSSLDGNTRRAIDIHEGEKVDARAFKALVAAAVDLDGALGRDKPKRAK